LVELNFTFVVFTFSFIIFLGLMKLFFFDPVQRVIAVRHQRIKEQLEASQKASNQIHREVETNDSLSILNQARQEAHKIMAASLESAGAESEKLIKLAVKEIEEKSAANIQSLEAEKDRLKGSLSQYVKEVADLALSKVFNELGSKERVAA